MSPQVNIRRLSVALLDLAVILCAWFLAFLLRFDFHIETPFDDIMLRTSSAALLIYCAAAQTFGLYRGIYHFSSFSDLINIVKAVASAALVTAAMVLFIRHGQQFPRSVLIIHPIIAFFLIGGIRFAIRLAKSLSFLPRAYPADSKRTLLVGAGTLGESVARQILNTPLARRRLVGFIDNDPNKWGMSIHACPVFGGLDRLGQVLDEHSIDEIVVTIEDRRGEVVRSIAESMADRESKPELRIAPSLAEMLSSPATGLSLRKVMPVDLLNRKRVRLDSDRIGAAISGKCVLVTGAGGTIGAELSRQCLLYKPSAVVLLDNHATSLFYIEMDVKARSQGVAVAAVLGDVRDRGLLEHLFSEHRPDIVLHAAAHKHVSQLETNIQEAASNNLLGTCRLAEAARKHRAGSFLLISTDKAVRPAGVMGATKRAAELAILHYSRGSDTRFTAVRFGNVLGSSGSVLELFREQIGKGGPIQVTHQDATRYFMTVEEAVQLVLQALSLGRTGDIFVLKMGSPVRILDMAKNLALLSGLTPGRDIRIDIVGLRPGEKIHEELIEDPAGHEDSGHPDIMVLRKENRASGDLPKLLAAIESSCETADPAAAKALLSELVPTFSQAAKAQ